MTWVSPAERRALRAVCVFSKPPNAHNGSRLDSKALHSLAVRGWIKATGPNHWRATSRGHEARKALREEGNKVRTPMMESLVASAELFGVND